jgi:hypothetical protein
MLLVGCSADEQRYVSPDGQREVVIDAGAWAIDRIWTVTIRDTGIFGHSEDVGCFTDDDPASGSPTGVSWTSANEFVIATDAQDSGVRVALNPDGSVREVKQDGNDLLMPCPAS